MTASLLAVGPFRALLAAAALERFANSAMTVMLGFQVYALTHNPFDLGLLGLVEAIPGSVLSCMAAISPTGTAAGASCWSRLRC